MLADISKASEHDICFLKHDHLLIGVELLTPNKKPKGRELSLAMQFRSCFISSTRQAIETAFSWLQARTGIATASKIRSTQGLRRQIFGCLLAAAIGCV